MLILILEIFVIVIIASEEIDTVTPVETKWDYCPVASTDHLVRLLLHQLIVNISHHGCPPRYYSLEVLSDNTNYSKIPSLPFHNNDR